MIYLLPSGRVVMVRDKFIRTDGHLVIEAEYWHSEADYRARLNQPRAAHDHLFMAANPPIDPNDMHVLPHIIAVFNGAIGDDGQGVIAVRRHARDHTGSDPHGWLAHPHVQGIKVVER